MSNYIDIGEYHHICDFEDFGLDQRALLEDSPEALDIWDTIVWHSKEEDLAELISEDLNGEFYITPSDLVDWLVEHKDYIYEKLDIPYEITEESDEETVDD